MMAAVSGMQTDDVPTFLRARGAAVFHLAMLAVRLRTGGPRPAGALPWLRRHTAGFYSPRGRL